MAVFRIEKTRDYTVMSNHHLRNTALSLKAKGLLPFRQMYPDGLCRLDDTTWSRCIEFEDVNYQLAGQDDQTAIFEALCDMYNAHDASIGMELTLICRKVNRADFRKRIEIAAQGDAFDGVRVLYTEMLRTQLEHGNNGMVKTKFLVLTIEAGDIRTARARFSRITLDALGHFKAMGALAKALDGREWLEVLHGVLHPDGERFSFAWEWLAPSGLHVKDFIVPSSFRFGEARRFRMGAKYGAASFLQITAPELNDWVLADLLDTDSSIFVSLHIRSMDQNEAIKTVKRKITDLDSMKIDAQKRAAREGFDIDILPSDLATYAGEAKNILRDLQSRNERMFLMTFLVVNVADTRQKLENDILRASSVAQKHNCHLVRLDFQQEQGFVSALPLGVNQVKIQRGLTTSSVAIFVPFISQELFQGGEALYYGLNATSGNMILADRKQLKTPNGLILGTPGSGKSFSAKREILNVFLVTKDDIIICDPEAEYFPVVHRLGGQVIKISPTSSQYVNPMDMSLNYSEDDSPLALKSDFTAQDFLRKLHPDLMGFLRRHLPRLKRLDQMAAQVRPLVNSMAAGPGKFNVRCFGGAAIGRYQQLPVRFFGIADIVDGRFQRRLDRMRLCNCHIWSCLSRISSISA